MVVRMEIRKVRRRTAFGYMNVWAGEHLNLVSSDDPHLLEGDIITIRVCDAANHGDHWYISYELLSVD